MRIGICAPSTPFTHEDAARISALAAAARPTAELVFHDQCFAEAGHFAGSDGERLEAFVDLANDPDLAAAYKKAHEAYLTDRDALGLVVEEVEGISAGGMPDRVKCLHSLVAHSLSAGPGVNPLGDEALRKLPEWWKENACNSEMNA